jgi:hypothetical protein
LSRFGDGAIGSPGCIGNVRLEVKAANDLFQATSSSSFNPDQGHTLAEDARRSC